MWMTLVIILTPFTDDFPGMADIVKPVVIQAFLREVIHAGQALDPATGGQRVHNKIHRKGQIRHRRAEKRQTF